MDTEWEVWEAMSRSHSSASKVGYWTTGWRTAVAIWLSLVSSESPGAQARLPGVSVVVWKDPLVKCNLEGAA